jgi:hypothetical protein
VRERQVGRDLAHRPARAQLAKIEAEWEKHLGRRRMGQLREALEMLGEITDPYR